MSNYQEIKEKAIQYAEESHTDKTVIMAVAAAMNAKLDYNKLATEEGRMCKVFDEIKKEGEVRGRAFGIIDICLEFGLSESDILSRLQKKFEVSLEVAQDYFVKYKRRDTLEAMEEARRISKDPNTKRYGSFTEVLEEFYNPVNQQCLYKSIERLEKGDGTAHELIEY